MTAEYKCREASASQNLKRITRTLFSSRLSSSTESTQVFHFELEFVPFRNHRGSLSLRVQQELQRAEQ